MCSNVKLTYLRSDKPIEHIIKPQLIYDGTIVSHDIFSNDNVLFDCLAKLLFRYSPINNKNYKRSLCDKIITLDECPNEHIDIVQIIDNKYKLRFLKTGSYAMELFDGNINDVIYVYNLSERTEPMRWHFIISPNNIQNIGTYDIAVGDKITFHWQDALCDPMIKIHDKIISIMGHHDHIEGRCIGMNYCLRFDKVGIYELGKFTDDSNCFSIKINVHDISKKQKSCFDRIFDWIYHKKN